MAKLKLTDEQLETMSYGDVARFVLENNKKPLTIQYLIFSNYFLMIILLLC